MQLVEALAGDRHLSSNTDREALAACAVFVVGDGSVDLVAKRYWLTLTWLHCLAESTHPYRFGHLHAGDFKNLAAMSKPFSVEHAVAALESQESAAR